MAKRSIVVVEFELLCMVAMGVKINIWVGEGQEDAFVKTRRRTDASHFTL